MTTSVECDFCHYEFPLASELCPHCARPALYPNVRAAEQEAERNALEQRYQSAVSAASDRGADAVRQDFEAAVGTSMAVIARPLGEMMRLANSDNEIYTTYYNLVEAGIRLPGGDKWDTIRALAEEAVFPGYKKHIRFGALTLNDLGIPNYGECSFILREEMIAHRASVFEENNVVWLQRQNFKFSELPTIPPGYRATWQDRGKLAVAKLGQFLTPQTTPESYPDLLLSGGSTSAEDQFIEVHIWGPITARTMESVTITQPGRAARKTILKALQEKLGKRGVKVEVR